MKRLRENGYVLMDEDGYLTLTDSGNEIASNIYERHTVLSEYLMQLGVSEENALSDACRIEHVLSEESFQRIKELTMEARKSATEANA